MTVARVIDLTKFMFEPPGHYTVHDMFTDYSRERLIAKGKDCRHAWCGFNFFMDVVPPQQKAEEITSGQVEDFIDLRMTRCTSILSPRRELSFVKAAVKNAYRRNRIKNAPYIELPEGQGKFRRPLSEPEFRLVMELRALLERFMFGLTNGEQIERWWADVRAALAKNPATASSGDAVKAMERVRLGILPQPDDAAR